MAVEKGEKRKLSLTTSKDKKSDEKKTISDIPKRKSTESGSGTTAEKKVKLERKLSSSDVKREHSSGAAKLTRKTTTTSSKVTDKDSKKEKKKMFPDFSEEDIIEEENVTFEIVSKEFSSTVDKIKETMKHIIELKKDGLEDKDKLSQLRSEGCLNISSMKRLNRFSQICTKKIRENTKNILQDSDSHFLKLQNLQYQAHHLKSEIEQCLGFQSLHKSLNMVDVEDFQLDAPDELANACDGSEHELTKARLKFELLQRKQLEEDLQKSKENREKLDDLANIKRTNLNNIRPQVQNILQAANNVRTKMGLGGVVGIIGEAASFLTEPLSMIYKAGIAFNESNPEKIAVSVKGDEKEAIEMKEKGFEDEEGERKESGEGEDGGRRSRRKKKSLKGWFPVWVEWKIGQNVVQFRHSTLNRQIYAESSKEYHQPHLSGLYSEDSGAAETSSSASAFGRSYYWAAKLGGIADLQNGESFKNFVSDLIDRIEKRFTNKKLLDSHLAVLTKKELPVNFENTVLSIALGTFASFEPVVEFESARNIKPYEDGKVYQIEIDRKLEKKFIVLCSISPNYPIDPPRLSITDSDNNTAATSSQLQYLEEYVNYRLPLSIADEDQSEILSRQIASLLMQPMTTKVVTRNRFYPTQLL